MSTQYLTQQTDLLKNARPPGVAGPQRGASSTGSWPITCGHVADRVRPDGRRRRSRATATSTACCVASTCPSTTPTASSGPSANFGIGPDDVDLIVASDSEEILGIGDSELGGGAGIAAGTPAVYTAAAGIDPARVIPVALDVGTDNEELLNDPFYVGNRHSRVRGLALRRLHRGLRLVATRLFPNAMLHWEDFGPSNARRILEKYTGRIPHLQRRHAGHRRDRAPRPCWCRPRLRHADARPADRRLRLRYGGHGVSPTRRPTRWSVPAWTARRPRAGSGRSTSRAC